MAVLFFLRPILVCHLAQPSCRTSVFYVLEVSQIPSVRDCAVQQDVIATSFGVSPIGLRQFFSRRRNSANGPKQYHVQAVFAHHKHKSDRVVETKTTWSTHSASEPSRENLNFSGGSRRKHQTSSVEMLRKSNEALCIRMVFTGVCYINGFYISRLTGWNSAP